MPVREEAADCASVEAVSPQTLEVPQTQLPTAKETEVVDELDLNDRALFEMVSLTREIPADDWTLRVESDGHQSLQAELSAR
jgi:hypothetical protein